MKSNDIRQLPNLYQVDIPLVHFKNYFYKQEKEKSLTIQPDFQKGFVWHEQQRINYVEYVLRGGGKEKLILANENEQGFVLVDGLQRLTTLNLFLDDKLRVFGCLYSEFEPLGGKAGLKFSITIGIKFGIAQLQTRKEVLQWYIDLNSGTEHTQQEIDKVKYLLEQENQ